MTNHTLLHPTDADLLAYLDSEISIIDAPRIARHVEQCDECRRTIDDYRVNSSSIEHLLASIVISQPQPPRGRVSRTVRAPRLAIVPRAATRQRYSRPSLRAAMIVVGVGAATLAVTPVRGWVVEFFRAVTGSGQSTVVESASRQTAPPVAPLTSASSVSVVPRAGEFTIRLATTQTAGTLTIAAVSGNQATGRITDRRSSDALLVTASGFRVQNRDASTASYAFGLPSSVTSFEVWIGDRVALRGTRDELTDGGTVRLDLARHSR